MIRRKLLKMILKKLYRGFLLILFSLFLFLCFLASAQYKEFSIGMVSAGILMLLVNELLQE